MGLGLIDLYTELDKNKPEWYLADKVHPSVAGSGIIAQKVKEVLIMSKPEISYTNGKVTASDSDDYQWYIDGKPVSADNGGKQKEMVVTQTGIYKVSVKLSANSETRMISKELKVTGVIGLGSKKGTARHKGLPNSNYCFYSGNRQRAS